jgi:hypothetical protein
VTLSSICSLIPSCGAVNNYGDIIMYLISIMSRMGISLLSVVGYFGRYCSMVPLVAIDAIVFNKLDLYRRLLTFLIPELMSVSHCSNLSAT